MGSTEYLLGTLENLDDMLEEAERYNKTYMTTVDNKIASEIEKRIINVRDYIAEEQKAHSINLETQSY